MLSGLPKQLWAYEVSIATYLINRGASVLLEHKIPNEVWSKKEVKLLYLNFFGYIAYVCISD